jgi:serine protease Do
MEHMSTGVNSVINLPDSFSPALEKVKPALVMVRDGRRGSGAGVIWRREGWIITNQHVIGSHRRMQIHLANGKVLEGQVVARHPQVDLALLRLPAGEYPSAWIGDSHALRVGELVLAAGHPWGEPGFLTLGIISALSQAVDRQGRPLIPIIRSDARLAPGNSGGPLFNVLGAVVGINTLIIGGDQGVAIPSQVAEDFVQQALAELPVAAARGNGKG